MGESPEVAVRTIADDDGAEMMSLAHELAAMYESPHDPRFCDTIEHWITKIPAGVREIARAPHAAATVLRRFPVRDEHVGPTPASWEDVGAVPAFGYVLALIGAALGRPFGWAGQQDGRLVNSIMPTKGHEELQTGASSSVLLSPHTEDAFHFERAHLIMLGCLRNHDRIGTTLASVRQALETGVAGGVLDEADIAFLRQAECPILPDDSYSGGEEDRRPAPIATLWEREDGTCLRYDPAYTPAVEGREAWQRAYRRLSDALEAVSTRVALEPGEILIVDNDVAVHGRVPFTARFDGTDRWLLRLNIEVPERRRPAMESFEQGFGQKTVRPFGVLT